MTTTEIGKRLTALEAEVASLKSEKRVQRPWWNMIAGSFSDNPRFEEAMRLGRQEMERIHGKVPAAKKPAGKKRKARK